MTASIKPLLIVAALVGMFAAAPTARAQQPAQAPESQRATQLDADIMELFDTPSPSKQRVDQAASIPSPAQLRQALAWHQRLQRVARTEAALRRGYHLSRPPGVVTPSTTSRFPYHRTIVIPVYVDHLHR
ncbi:hypothetical protein [Roseimaritima sediminicola]|uniref:hypothetical protein n=1 Tax=Roseimaritima sediminicola TaxID=2662066 RepID=UPI00129826C8|nr:hypothetical protein [Roseimaritima sediminicola]